MSTSINKIHVNSTTKISLNDRFTVIQSTTSPVPNQKVQLQLRKSPAGDGRLSRSNSLNRPAKFRMALPNGNSNGTRSNKQASFASRKFLEQLERKHKLQAALKLKRRSLKANLAPIIRGGPRGGRRLYRNGGTGGRNRGSISGRLTRSNSLSNLSTMQADLLTAGRRIKPSISTSNLAARLGTVRRTLATQNVRRLRTRRGGANVSNNINPPIVRGRSRSRQRNLSGPNLNRSNSQANLNRSNSRTNLYSPNNGANASGQRRARSRSISRNRLNFNEGRRGEGRGRGNRRNRSASRSRTNLQTKTSVHSRLGVKGLPAANKRRLSQNVRGNGVAIGLRGGRRVAQGRIVKRKNSTAGVGATKKSNIGARQGRIGRGRGRGAAAIPSRTRSQSRGRSRSVQASGSVAQRGSRRGRSRGRGGRAAGRGINRPAAGQTSDIKREDLDKELDQYMSTTQISSDIEM